MKRLLMYEALLTVLALFWISTIEHPDPDPTSWEFVEPRGGWNDLTRTHDGLFGFEGADTKYTTLSFRVTDEIDPTVHLDTIWVETWSRYR